MRSDLHIILQWLEENVTPEKRRAYELLDEGARLSACREMLRKNSTAVGLRKRDVDSLDEGAVGELSVKLYEKYRHYIDRMERGAKRRG